MKFDGDDEDDDENENKGAKVAGDAQNDDLSTGIEVGFSKFITNEFWVSKEKKNIETVPSFLRFFKVPLRLRVTSPIASSETTPASRT